MKETVGFDGKYSPFPFLIPSQQTKMVKEVSTEDLWQLWNCKSFNVLGSPDGNRLMKPCKNLSLYQASPRLQGFNKALLRETNG